MARRATLIKIKQKQLKKTRTEQYAINLRYLGDEPVFTTRAITQLQHIKNLNWYSMMCSNAEAKEYLITYLKNVGRDAEAKTIKSLHEKWMPTTACWIARMRSRGAQLPEDAIENFENGLQYAISITQRATLSDCEEEDGGPTMPVPKSSQKPSIQDRMKRQLSTWIADLEEEFDKFWTDLSKPTTFSMYSWLQTNEIPQVQAKRIHEFYEPKLLEVESVYLGEADKDIIEGYESYSKDDLKKLYGYLVMYVEDLEQYCQNEKKTRKTRAKKPISLEKKLKDFKYLKFDSLRKIQSVQPERIIGSTELWAFSTRYNQLTVFRAISGQGLDVHRTAITNYDPNNSLTKKLRAKDVDGILREVMNAGKVTLRNIMKNARGTDQNKLQVRMNENTVLLRVISK